MTAPPTTHLRARPRRLAAIAVTATLAAGAIGPALVASAVAPAPARGATPAAKPAPPASPSPGGRAVPSAAPGPDFSSYQALLDDYLVVTSAPGASIDTRFDYERLYDARDRNPRLDRIRADLLAVSPDSMAPGVRRAWAVNTYNFLVLETATRNLLIPMRGRTRYTDPREIRVQGAQFFKAPIVTIDSIVLSPVSAGSPRAARRRPGSTRASTSRWCAARAGARRSCRAPTAPIRSSSSSKRPRATRSRSSATCASTARASR
jgi:hypothetical protein